MMVHRSIRTTVLALSLACALGLPLAASAQDASREAALEARVTQLEHQLDELKAMLAAQQAATPPAPAAAPVATPVAAAPAKPVFSTAPGVSVALHGFVSATAFQQSRSFTYGNGQNALYPQPGSSGSVGGVDIRNTRFWLDFAGARLNDDWSGGGRIEMDFFGGFNGSGAYSQQQPTPRLRQAYMDLVNAQSGTTVRVGQMWDLMFPITNLSTSLAHVAFPLGYGSGVIGWRYPGVVVMQDLNHGADGAKWRLDLGVFEGHWNGPGNSLNYQTAGNAGFRPQVEARLNVTASQWLAYFATRYQALDLRGVDGHAPTPIRSKITSASYELGGQWKPGAFTFKGFVYQGNALGNIFGAMSQFGDIDEHGGYLQAGYAFNPNWSLYATYATARPDKTDVATWLGAGASGLLRNQQSALAVQYASGAYQFGMEYLHAKLDSTTDGVDRHTTSGSQVSLNAMYSF